MNAGTVIIESHELIEIGRWESPAPIFQGDRVWFCPLCGVLRIDREGTTIYSKDHDYDHL